MTPKLLLKCPPVFETASRVSHRSSCASCLICRMSRRFISAGLLMLSNIGLTAGPEYGGPSPSARKTAFCRNGPCCVTKAVVDVYGHKTRTSIERKKESVSKNEFYSVTENETLRLGTRNLNLSDKPPWAICPREVFAMHEPVSDQPTRR